MGDPPQQVEQGAPFRRAEVAEQFLVDRLRQRTQLGEPGMPRLGGHDATAAPVSGVGFTADQPGPRQVVHDGHHGTRVDAEQFADVGAERYGYAPDMITTAKGLTSGYAPLGAVLISDRLAEPFHRGDATFMHGSTYGGYPVSCAVALANLDLIEREGLLDHVRRGESVFRSTLDKLRDLPIVGDVRGAGFFYGIELVKDKGTRETFTSEESERILRGHVSAALFDSGLYCRADDRAESAIQLARR